VTLQDTEPPAADADTAAYRSWRSRAGLLRRTVVHLTLAQVVHRARLRGQRALDPWWFSSHRWNACDEGGSTPGWPAGFHAIESRLDHGRPEDVAAGCFDLVGAVRSLGEPMDWVQHEASHLWRFHLHYFEWAWSLAAAPDREWARASFARLWRSWSTATAVGRGDAWAPYVVSLRAWVLCDVFDALAAGTAIEDHVRTALRRHAQFLRTHLELDVGGNHLIKNLKALIGLGIFLGSPPLLDLATRHLIRQIPVQVLTDGGHFERSPSYHCQVLGDLLDIRALLVAAGEMPVPEVDAPIAAMQAWLGAMLGADGEVPFFNDAVPVGSARLAQLAPHRPPQKRLAVLAASGYVVMHGDRVQVVADVGDPCPEELPAHAHAGCLSFEMWMGDQKVVADAGTSTYEPGRRRDYERSTAAHNTIEIDGSNQTEVWGTFRAARRAHGRLHQATDDGESITVVASHDGYRHLHGSPVHRRTWTLSPGRLVVEDHVTSSGGHTLISRLHCPAPQPSSLTVRGSGGALSEQGCRTARGFGVLEDAVVHCVHVDRCPGDARARWELRW